MIRNDTMTEGKRPESLRFSIVVDAQDVECPVGLLVDSTAFFQPKDELVDGILRCEGFFAVLGESLKLLTNRMMLRVFVPIDECLGMTPTNLLASLSRLAFILERQALEVVLCLSPMAEALFEEDREILNRIQSLGFLFGAHQVRLSSDLNTFLTVFPASYVLFAPSFLTSACDDRIHRAIFTGVLSAVRQLDIRSVACGVTSEVERLFLEGAACDYLEGEFVAKQNQWPLQGGLSINQVDDVLNHYARRRALVVPQSPVKDRVLLFFCTTLTVPLPVQQLMEAGRCHVMMAESIESAWAQLNQEPVDVMIVDHASAGENLMDFLTEVKDRLPGVRVVLLSEAEQINSVLAVLNEDLVFRVLFAPYPCVQLEQVVHRAFEYRDIFRYAQLQRRELQLVRAKLAETKLYVSQVLSERTEHLRHDEEHLTISQEMLFKLPVLLLGFDPDGMLALSNAIAQETFPAARMLGIYAEEFLPPCLLALLTNPADNDVRVLGEAQGLPRPYRVQTVVMDDTRGRGTVLVMIPNQ